MYINDIMRDVNPILKGSYLLMAYDVIIIHSYNRDMIHNKTFDEVSQHRYVVMICNLSRITIVIK